MTALTLVDPAAPGPSAELLAAVKARLGVTPNMTRAMANSPALLKGYLDFSTALSSGVIGGATAERIALAVAQANECDYCLSAHTFLSENVARLDASDIASARKAQASDAKTDAILTLARAVNEGRGKVGPAEFDAARAAGLSDQEVAEVIGHVALNVLTNYFNKAADVEIDFPLVTAGS